jgi:tetratricopeptide (TPR) repeat protein
LLEAEALRGEEEASVNGVRITAAKCGRWEKRARIAEEQKSTRTKDLVRAFDTPCSIVRSERLLCTLSTDSSNTPRHEQSSDMLIMSSSTLPEDQANSFPRHGSTGAHLSPLLAASPTKATSTGFSSSTLPSGSFEPVHSLPGGHLNRGTVQVREQYSESPSTPRSPDRYIEITTQLLSRLELDPTDITLYGPPTHTVPEVSTSGTDTISLKDLETCNHDGRLVPWFGKQATLHKTASPCSTEVTRHHGEKPSRQGTIVLVPRHYSSKKRTTNGALKYSFADVIFPSSQVVEPDPFSLEVYPFPQNQGRRLKLRPTATIYESNRMSLNDCIAKINKLESACLGSKTVATKLKWNLAAAYYNFGYYDKAEYQYRQILQIFEQNHGQNSWEYVSAKIYLSDSISRLGRPQEGYQMAQDAHILARRFYPGSSLYQIATSVLATSFRFLDDTGSAEILLRELVQITLTTLGPKHGKTISVISNLCSTMVELKRYSESEDLLRVTLELSFDATDLSDRNQCTIRYKLGELLYNQDRYADSEALLRVTAKMSEKLLGIEHGQTLKCKNLLAKVLRTRRLLSESHDIPLEIIEVQIKKLGEIRGSTIRAMADLSVVLIEMRNMDEAYKWMKQALRYCVETGGIQSDRAEQFLEDLSSINEIEEQHELIQDLYERIRIKIAWIDVVRWDRLLSALSPQPCLLLLDSYRKSSCPSAPVTDTGYLHDEPIL